MDKPTSRLRTTFKYPTDNDEDDDLPEAMDEEEQDTLITHLSTLNKSQNKTTTQLLLILPVLSIIPYIPSLFSPKTSFLALLSITSLCCTSYLLYFLPPEETGFRLLDNLHSFQNQTQNRQRRGYGRAVGGDGGEGPIEKYLPRLNLGVCIILVILGGLVRRRIDVWMGFSWVPGFVLGVVLGAKWVMGSVDPESELGGLRYGFKGA